MGQHNMPQWPAKDGEKEERAGRAEGDSPCDQADGNCSGVAAQTQGKQTAEWEGAKAMQQAGEYLGQKRKDTGVEANKEREDDKEHKEQEYKPFESKHAGSTQNSQSQVRRLQGCPAPDGTTPQMEPIAHMDR